jgi:hypothetical protein
MFGSMGEEVSGSVTGRDRSRQFRYFLHDVREKFPVGVRLPSYRWTRPISEPRPVDSNGLKGGR